MSQTNENELAMGYSDEDKQKALRILTKVLPHVARENLVIVGGLAMRHHWIRHGIDYPKRPFNDLDLMIKDQAELKPSITEDFHIYHYHPPRGTSFYAGLIDRETKVKVDIFDYFHPPINPEVVQVAGVTLRIRGAEDQLTKTVYDLMKITDGQSLGPKQFVSAALLLQVVNLEEAEQIWKMKYFAKYPFSLQDALSVAENERIKHPERVFEHSHRRMVYVCSGCEEISGFPITPMDQVYSLLGYVD